MGFVALKCPSCGGSFELDDSMEFGFCTYCGTKVMQEKIVVEHKGTINVDGIANANTILDRAFLFIEDEKFHTAFKYIEKTLDLNPRCSKAYFAKLLCQCKCSSPDKLIDLAVKPLSKYELFNKAKRFANSKELQEYEKLEKEIAQKFENRNNAYKNRYNSLDKQAKDLKEYIKKNSNQYKKDKLKTTLNKVIRIAYYYIYAIIIFSTLIFVAVLLETKDYLFMFVLMLFPIAATVLLIYLVKKPFVKPLISEFEMAERDYYLVEMERNKVKLEWENWAKPLDEVVKDDFVVKTT